MQIEYLILKLRDGNPVIVPVTFVKITPTMLDI